MSYVAGLLLSAVRNAVRATQRPCVRLGTHAPALQCVLFNSVVKPIRSYASNVWADDPKAGASVKKLQKQLLKHC